MATVLGKRFIRADGPEKVTGQAPYTADLTLTGMLHGRILWAGRPAARIVRLDTSAAEALPGVIAVVTHADVPDLRYGMFVKDRRLFATESVRFEGDAVAAVAATSEEIADRALELIEVTYEDLPAVLDPERALDPDSPLVHPDWESYEAGDGVVRGRNESGYATTVKGDVEAGMAEADIVVKERYDCDLSHPVPIEPHAIVAQWQGDKVTVWSSTQVPFLARSGVAETLQMPESNVRIVVTTLGGGFGGKCDFHYEAHVAALARKAGRPVRLVFSRREEFIVNDKTQHALVVEVETGMRSNGEMTARRCRIVIDSGAYAADTMAEVATMMAAGPYRIPHLHIEGFAPYTNKTPGGSVRAPLGPQVCWAIEQHTDSLAERAGLDPYEFRMRNLAENGDEGPTRQVYDSIAVKECLARAAELVGYGADLPPDEAIGLACGWWFSCPSPSGAYVKLNGDGSGTIVTGAQENGTGAVMGLALLAAEELGMQPGDFRILAQDTDAGPWDMGSAGSQTTFNNGRAVVEAAREVREQLLDLAEEELEAARADLELADGQVRVKGSPTRAVSIARLAETAQGDRLLLGRGSGHPPDLPEHDVSACVGRLAFGAFAAPAFFAQAARVRVDRETGVVRVLEVGCGHDFGRVLNPIGVEGQVEGGVVHGIGIALSEGTQWLDGMQVNPHLLDYKLRTSADAPDIHVAFVESAPPDGGPHGIKGVGEPPVVPTAGAVANAISRVLGRRQPRLPMTPERVWAVANGEEVR